MADTNQNASQNSIETTTTSIQEGDTANINAAPCIVESVDAAGNVIAPIQISKPDGGESFDVLVMPGQKYFFTFEETDVASFVQQGGDLVLNFEDGSAITLRNFGDATSGDVPATLAFSSVLDGSDYVSFENVVETVPSEDELVEVQAEVRESNEDVEIVASEEGAEVLANVEPAAGEEAEVLAEIEPAAGDTGGVSQGRGYGFQSSFSPTPVNPLEDVGPIDPTALQFDRPNVDGDLLFFQSQNAPADDQPQLLSPDPQEIDETNLGPIVVTDTIAADFGNDGPGTISADGTFGFSGSVLGGTLTSGGNAIDVQSTATGYVGTINGGADTVFDLVIDPKTGEYTFTQHMTLDHADGTDANDEIVLDFGFVAEDDDGDQAFTTLQVTVADDAPVVDDTYNTVDESDLGPVVVTGDVAPDFGNDGEAAANSFVGDGSFASSGSKLGGDLTHNGTAVTTTFDAGTNTYTGTAGSETIFTMVINNDGTYEFTLLSTLDHADPNDPNDIISLKFGVDAVDYDGDAGEASIIIDVKDDVPTIKDAAGDVDESGFGNGPLVYTDTVEHNSGPDFAEVNPTGTTSSSVPLTTTPDGLGGTSYPITITLSGNTYTGVYADSSRGDQTVFTMEIDPTTGEYTYTQFQAIDHPDASDPNDVVSIDFGVEIESIDGTTAPATVTINVADDAPVARDDVNGAEEDQFITGDVITNDDLSADASAVSNVNFDGTDYAIALGGNVTITGDYGTLVMNSDGTYNYTASSNDPDGIDTFTYTLVDGDGDSDRADLQIRVTPDGEPVADRGELTVDETDLTPPPADLTGQIDIDFGLDGQGGVEPNGTIDVPANLTSGGEPVVITQTANGYEGAANGTPVFTLSVDDTGEFYFELHGPIDHPDSTDPNDAVTLEFGVTVSDSDGDETDTQIVIYVRDDAPVARDDVSGAEEGQLITGDVTLNDEVSEDAPTTVVNVAFDGTDYAVVPGTATVINGDYGVLTINANGSYTYQASDIGNPDGTDQFTYTLVDYDGDADTANLDITVTPDGEPIVGGGSLTVDETDLDNPPANVTGDLNINFGIDGAGGVEPNGTVTGSEGSALSLTSKGQPVVITQTATGYVGTVGGSTLFTLTVDDAGAFSFDLFGPIDHPDGTDPNEAFNIEFGVSVTDSDGDATDGIIDIFILDDAPVALDDARSVDDAQTINGNVTNNDEASEDTPTRVSEVSFDGNDQAVVPGTATVINGDYGVLTINANGSYSYAANSNNPGGVDVFTYSYTDYDGDTDTAELSITVGADDNPEINNVDDLVTDETDLNPTDSDSGQVVVDFGNDGPGVVSATDASDFSFGGSLLGGNLTSNGNPVTVSLNGNTYTGSANGQDIFTLAIQNDGSYTFTLIGTLDHADPNDPNDIITLGFGVQATDGDGDVVTDTIRVNVLDDVPTIGDSGADVDESDFANGDLATSNTLFTDFGSDVATIVPGGSAVAEVNGNPIALTSGGDTVTMTQTADGYVGTINGGATTVFTLTINATTGLYEYTQSAPFDHPDGTNADDIINLVFGVDVTSTDGDSDSAEITISVADDGVVARDDVNGAEEGQLITGSVVSNDDFSEDTPNVVTEISYNGTDYTITPGTATDITTSLGVLSMNSDGTYTFTATNSGDPDGIDRFTYTLVDGDGDSDRADLQIRVTPDGEPVADRGELTVDETDLTPPPADLTGQIDIDFGLDGQGGVEPNGTIDVPANLTSGGEPVVITQTANGYEGAANGTPVFTLSVDDTGEFYFELHGPIDHPDSTDPNDAVTLEFGVTVSDSDGDETDTQIVIYVRDDAPVARDDVSGAEEGQLITGDVTLNDEVSEDAPTTVVNVAFDGTDYAVVPGTATVINGDYGVLTINANGSYTYQASDIGNPDGTDQFTYTLVDYDGDADTANLDITVTPDGEPIVGGGSLTVDETDLDNPPANVTGDLNINFGIDGAGGVEPNGTVTGSEGSALSLTSKGQPVVITQTATGYVGTVGGSTLFTLTVDDAGAFSFDLFGPIDHPDGTDPNEAFNIEFGVSVTDSDGDATDGIIDIFILDDAPVALDDARSVDDAQTINGNVTNNDEASEDTPTRVSEVSFDGNDQAVVPGTATVINGDYGVLTINANGSYSYAANSNNPGGVDVFTYSYTDYDGDTDTAELSITVGADDNPEITNLERLETDDTDLNPTDSDSGSVTANFFNDGPGTYAFNGTSTSSTALSSNGDAVTVSLVNGDYVGKTAGGDTIFKLTLNETTGAYDFTQFAPLDHPNTNSHNESIVLRFGVDAVDADGDTASGTILVDVRDDGPVISDRAVPIQEGGLSSAASISVTNSLVHDYGEDGAGSIKPTGTFMFLEAMGGTPQTLTSGGQIVDVTATNDGYVGKVGNDTIFTISINNNGQYTYTQFAPIDHPDASDPNEAIWLKFQVEITDFDGDTDTAFVIIDVHDDAPVAVNDTDSTTAGDTVTGNVIDNDDTGVDVPVSVTNVNVNGTDYPVVAGTPTVVNGTYGTLTINANGSYSYTAGANSPDGTDVITYTLTDYDGDSDTGDLRITVDADDQPVVTDNDPKSVDEDNLDNGDVTVTGTVAVDYGDDNPGTITPKDVFDSSVPLTSGGQPVVVTATNDGYVGKVGNTMIFTLSLNPSTGSYDFTLKDVLDHPNTNAPNEAIELSFCFDVTDADGDTTVTEVVINVRDSAPDAKNDSDSVGEGELVSGNVRTNDDKGEDTPADVTSVRFDGTDYPVVPGTPTVVQGDYGTLRIWAGGNYRYTANSNNPDGVDDFYYTLTDADGDSDVARLRIDVSPDDRQPTNISGSGSTDDSNLDSGPDVETGTINVNYNGDGAGKTEGNGDFSHGTNNIDGNVLRHEGQQINVSFNASNDTYTGKAGGKTIFTMKINDNGTYRFTQYETIDHGKTGQDNESVNLNFGVKAFDADGDAGEGTITIRVHDDGVTANDDIFNNVTGIKTGNVLNNDDLSQDQDNIVVSVNYNGVDHAVPATGFAWIIATTGVLRIASDGSYTFTQSNVNGVKPAGSNDFTYTVKDGDGDKDTAKLEINTKRVVDPIPPGNPGDHGDGGGADGGTPLVVDLDRDGNIELVSKDDGVYFDMGPDGILDQTGWVAPDDGLLALDVNKDGVINDHSELFGTLETDGFTILAQYDSNNDGVIDAQDEVFGELVVWQDANQNGYSESDELLTMSDLGIESISLTATESDEVIEGNTVILDGSLTYEDGTEGDIVDAVFQFESLETLYGNDNAQDTFIFTAETENPFVIEDFNASEGDVLDLSGLLTEYDAVQDSIDDFIFQTDNGDDTVVYIDQSGSGNIDNATAVAVLDGVSGLPVEDIVKNTNVV